MSERQDSESWEETTSDIANHRTEVLVLGTAPGTGNHALDQSEHPSRKVIILLKTDPLP